MERAFYANKKSLLALCLVLLFLFVGFLILCLCVKSMRKSTPVAIVSLFYGFFLLNKVFHDFKMKLVLSEKEIQTIRYSTYDYGCQWEKVDRIEYHGIKIIPLFDSMVVISNGYKIIIDSTFQNYKEAWKLVVQNVEAHNKRAYIDPRIKKRLNLEAEPGNH